MLDISAPHWEMILHLGAAWLAGSLIGLERTYHSRPAGFRTHALVCVASALLMMVSNYQWIWLGENFAEEAIRTDPTRMAQGIMTGIGFLGAGVIFKEGLTVRGLTTAASIWVTSALGILYGVGFLFPAVFVTVVTLLTLSLFRLVESRIPTQTFAHHVLRFHRDQAWSEAKVRNLMEEHGFFITGLEYRLAREGAVYEYSLVLRTYERENIARLAEHLKTLEGLLEYRLAPRDV
ncbi:MgtC/SapB family protein [Halomonas sp. WWR20]